MSRWRIISRGMVVMSVPSMMRFPQSSSRRRRMVDMRELLPLVVVRFGLVRCLVFYLPCCSAADAYFLAGFDM